MYGYSLGALAGFPQKASYRLIPQHFFAFPHFSTRLSLYLKTLRISPHGIGNCLRPLAAEDKHGRDKLKNANLLRKEVTYFQPF